MPSSVRNAAPLAGPAAVDAASGGLSARPHLMLLAALLLFAVVLTPVAASAALRQAVE